MNGNFKFRALRLVLIGGIVAAFMLGPLLKLKWYTGELPGSPFRDAIVTVDRGSLSDEGSGVIRYAWGARGGDDPAPALTLRLDPTDFYAWWWTGGKHEIAADDKGPQDLDLEIYVPSADGLSPDALQPLCERIDEPDVPAVPFGHCQNGRGRMTVKRSLDNSSVREMLEHRQPLPQEDELPYAARQKVTRAAFWYAEDRASGRQKLLGWACRSGVLEAQATAPDALPKVDAQSDPRLRCYEPAGWLKRHKPAWFGLHRSEILLSCAPKGGCNNFFFYRERWVEVHYEQAPAGDAAMTAPWLFVSAWEMLERARDAAARPGPADVNLAEARTQLQVCRALTEEAESWHQQGQKEIGRKLQDAWNDRILPCEKAASLAIRMAEQHPAEAAPMLGWLTDTFLRYGASSSWTQKIQDARFKAIAGMGQENSRAMFDALATYVQHMPGVQRQAPEFKYQETLLQNAMKLAAALTPAVPPEQRDRFAQALANHYALAEDHAAERAVCEQWLAMVERQDGAQSPSRLQPLQRIASSLWTGNDFAGLRLAADRLGEAYLALPPQAVAGADSASDPSWSAFYSVFYYRNVAFHEAAFDAVLPRIDSMVARMAQNLGAENPLVRAAMFHQSEVRNRRAVEGAHIGGGYLGRFGY